jgi:hypothetical protein
LRLELRPDDTQELLLSCNCCGQPYHPDKSWEDRLRAVFFGNEKYAICPLCVQGVPEDVIGNDGYRERCHYEVARLQRLFESASRMDTRKLNRSAGPAYEELTARVAELEKTIRNGGLQFRVSEKGGVSVYDLGRFPGNALTGVDSMRTFGSPLPRTEKSLESLAMFGRFSGR